MYLHILDGRLQKQLFLDLLAFLLWNEETPDELTPHHLRFGVKLYEEVLTEMKKETVSNGKRVDIFGFLNLECEKIGTICSLEKRLDVLKELLEERLVEHF